MHLAHGADDAGGEPFFEEADGFGGVPLIAHLRLHFGATRGLGDRAGFANRVREGLLAIHVFAGRQGRERDDGVRVVGCGNDDGVDVLLFFQHHAVVHVGFRRRVTGEGRRGVVGIDVAERDDVLAGAGFEVGGTLALGADADGGEVEFIARRLGTEERAAEKLKAERGRGGGGEETAAGGERFFHGVVGAARGRWSRGWRCLSLGA